MLKKRLQKQITEEEIIIQIKCRFINLSKYQLRLMIRACNELLQEKDRSEYPKNFKKENAN